MAKKNNKLLIVDKKNTITTFEKLAKKKIKSITMGLDFLRV